MSRKENTRSGGIRTLPPVSLPDVTLPAANETLQVTHSIKHIMWPCLAFPAIDSSGAISYHAKHEERQRLALHGFFTRFAGANAHHIAQIGNEYLPIANLAGLSRFQNSVDGTL